jgi:hypothetical protein
VLRAEADRELNDGPPLEEALGINAAAARKRLERARRALKLRLWERPDDGDKDDSEKDDDDDEA